MRLWKQTKEFLDKEKTIPNPEYAKLVWWCDFSIDGKRYRFSTETTKWRQAEKFAKAKEAQAQAGTLKPSTDSFARLAFSEAIDRHITRWSIEPSKKTRQPPAQSSVTKEKQLAVKPKEFFGVTVLNQIRAEHVQQYSEWRAATGGPAIIGMELGLIRRLMKRAKLWQTLADDVVIPRPPETIGRALTAAQKKTLLAVASERPEWETAYLASVIALSTTMRGIEIKRLRWQDVSLESDPATLTIHKSKTSAGERIIPLTREAEAAFVRLRARSELFSTVQPDHFIFARFRSVGRFEGRVIQERRILEFDPTQAIGSWKKAWRKLTTQAGLPGLRFHDCRHSTITALLTNPNVSIQTAKSIAGHVSQRMIDRYSHIHLEAKRSAVEALSLPPQAQDDAAIDATELTV